MRTTEESAYDHKKVEAKWQEIWSKNSEFVADISASDNFYNLWMFPYPSGEGLHVGHAFASTGSDIYGRFKRMQKNEVFQPIGYDAFGIHSENYALKLGTHPRELIDKTVKRYELQLKSLGHAYDWTRTVNTSHLDYYRWTQWIFIELFKAGLAYRAKSKVNWCPSCKTVLADEQVIKSEVQYARNSENQKSETGNVCERCGTEVEKRDLEQWFFRITYYAQRLLDNLKNLDWSEKVKTAQANWIGKSEGVKILFPFDIDKNTYVEVFTTRPDTIFGVTYLALAPEHRLVTSILGKVKSSLGQDIRKYLDYSQARRDDERVRVKSNPSGGVKNNLKSGVNTGFYATNPLSGNKVPVYIADYVLGEYGSGAVMGVPAHDDRDFEFAKENGIESKPVVIPLESQSQSGKGKVEAGWDFSQGAFTGYGQLRDSGQFSGMNSQESIKSITVYIESNHLGAKQTNWHLRDWLISRQRYWGPPIPMTFCEKCKSEGRSWFTENKGKVERGKGKDSSKWDAAGWYPDENLPVELPYIQDFKPTGTGISPLAQDENFVNVKCPGCGGKARRETDVSDTFFDSAWYFLRYPSVRNSDTEFPWNREITKRWLPVDMYIGGAEHSVLHLLYARFLTMALSDVGLLNFEEPFSKFRAHGLLIKDSAKMSKSRGNVVNPDLYIEKFGADTLRCYLMFCGRFQQGGDFRDSGIEGMSKFLKRIWRISNKEFLNSNLELDKDSAYMMHKTIKRVTVDIENLSYNTAIAALMEWLNFLELKSESQSVNSEEVKNYLLLLAPFAPHITEEIWQRVNVINSLVDTQNKPEDQKAGKPESRKSIHKEIWPKWEESILNSADVTVAIQVNGKLRDKLSMSSGAKQSDVEAKAKDSLKVIKYLENKKYRTVYVKDKILNFVTEE